MTPPIIVVYFHKPMTPGIVAREVNYLDGVDCLEVVTLAGDVFVLDCKLVRSVWEDGRKAWPVAHPEELPLVEQAGVTSKPEPLPTVPSG